MKGFIEVTEKTFDWKVVNGKDIKINVSKPVLLNVGHIQLIGSYRGELYIRLETYSSDVYSIDVLESYEEIKSKIEEAMK